MSYCNVTRSQRLTGVTLFSDMPPPNAVRKEIEPMTITNFVAGRSPEKRSNATGVKMLPMWAGVDMRGPKWTPGTKLNTVGEKRGVAAAWIARHPTGSHLEAGAMWSSI